MLGRSEFLALYQGAAQRKQGKETQIIEADIGRNCLHLASRKDTLLNKAGSLEKRDLQVGKRSCRGHRS